MVPRLVCPGCALARALLAVPGTLLLERLHLHPRSAPDAGVTMLAVFGALALWSAAGRWLRDVVAARVNRWRKAD